MPTAAVHISVSKITNESLRKDERLFILGNIAPDCFRNAKYFGSRKLSHFSNDYDFNNIMARNENYIKFFNEYKEKLDDPFILGYLTHLITDTYWRDNMATKYEKIINGKRALLKKDNTYYTNQLDMNKYLYQNEGEFVEFLVKMFKIKKIDKIDEATFNNQIKELDITGLNGTIDYINNNIVNRIAKEKSQIYEIEDVLKNVYKCSSFVLETLDKLMKKDKQKAINH